MNFPLKNISQNRDNCIEINVMLKNNLGFKNEKIKNFYQKFRNEVKESFFADF